MFSSLTVDFMRIESHQWRVKAETYIYIYIYTHTHTHTHTAVAQWLRCCATSRKVTGPIPAGVSGFFIDVKILPIALWPRSRISL